MKFFKPLIIALSAIICSSCSAGKPDAANSALKKLTSMQSYSSDVHLSYISDKSTAEYTVTLIADSSGRYCAETKDPEETSGDKILFDGKAVWHINNADNDKISAAIPDKPERQQIILFEFVKNMLNTDGSQCESDDKSIVFSAQMPDVHKYMKSEKLWIGDDDLLPKKLIIYDADGKERVTAEFSDFKYNPETDENIFREALINSKIK